MIKLSVIFDPVFFATLFLIKFPSARMGGSSSKHKSSSESKNYEVDFEDFQILRAIGKGSFGKVCIVQKKDDGSMYAMKYMNKNQCIKKDAIRNVMKEIEILTSLDHPFLVNLWFSFQDDEDMFMVVDLLLGGDLRYHIQQGSKFSEETVKLYVAELSLALDYLRSRQILHRDIKPDNVILDEAGHVHITDFNIATILEDGQLATSLSGTKPYMAPEIFDCALNRIGGYSFNVDWWSLGITAYEILRGKRPFDIHSNTPLAEVRKMFDNMCPAFFNNSKDSVKDLIRQMLCVDVQSRVNNVQIMRSHPCMSTLDMQRVYHKKISPSFVPAKDQLNCDPTFELEEMIIEANPLHKKKKRLSKQISRKDHSSTTQAETDPMQDCLENVHREFLIFNRVKEIKWKEKERKASKSSEHDNCNENVLVELNEAELSDFSPSSQHSENLFCGQSCDKKSRNENDEKICSEASSTKEKTKSNIASPFRILRSRYKNSNNSPG